MGSDDNDFVAFFLMKRRKRSLSRDADGRRRAFFLDRRRKVDRFDLGR